MIIILCAHDKTIHERKMLSCTWKLIIICVRDVILYVLHAIMYVSTLYFFII